MNFASIFQYFVTYFILETGKFSVSHGGVNFCLLIPSIVHRF